MARWLVCFPAELPAAERAASLAGAGVRAAPGAPVPLGDQVAVQVEADADAISALRRQPGVIAVYPDSEQTAY